MVPRTLVFGIGKSEIPGFRMRCKYPASEEAQASPYPVTCFRIPAVVQTSSGAILAFAEARINTCSDCAELGIAMRRSEDGGLTWGNVTWPVPPTPTGPGHEMARGGNPTVVFDSKRHTETQKTIVTLYTSGIMLSFIIIEA